MKAIRAQVILFVTSVVLCCVVYPGLLWAFGQGVMPTKANGSLVVKGDGTVVGSRLIAQGFSRDEYFWPRPSATGYNAAATGGSNWGASQPKLRFRVARQLGPIAKYADGRPVGPDIERWFVQQDRLAEWATTHSTAAAEWVKTSDDTRKIVAEWCKTHPDVIEQWKKDNPTATEVPDPESTPDAVAVPFFVSFATVHPRAFPTLTEGKVSAVTGGADLQGVFFDAWLQEHPKTSLATVPADMVMASGAGIDPHISLKNARWQLDRVAQARAGQADVATTRSRIEAIMTRASFSPLNGIVGEPLINVLEVNLLLDAEFAAK